jgi:hypothetical protein
LGRSNGLDLRVRTGDRQAALKRSKACERIDPVTKLIGRAAHRKTSGSNSLRRVKDEEGAQTNDALRCVVARR